MAQKKASKKVSKRGDRASNPLVGTVRKTEPLGRGLNPPALLKQAPSKTYAFRLEPLSKIHGPVNVWGYKTEHGWTGWIEEHRRTQLKPTHWSAEKWSELPALPAVQKVAAK